jgi:DMSO/TMAO reductase YedYZ molybdopterin-dependent catalytic subunit
VNDTITSPTETSSARHRSRWQVRALAALAGLLAAAVAVGLAELVAGALGVTSIVVSVGEGVIAVTPPALAELAITAIGGLNRPLLVTGTLVVLGLLSVGIGLLALRSLLAGVVAIGLLGVVGVAAALANPVDQLPAAVLPGLAAMIGGIAALSFVNPGRWRGAADLASAGPGARGGAVDRRGFLKAAGALSVIAAASVGAGRWLQQRASAMAERMELVLPSPDAPAAPLPDGVDFDIDGLTRFTTPNDRFYRIDTAVQVPNLLAEQYRLRIHGMVDEEVELTYDDLLSRELVEADITLTCVSNEVGGDLVGNARWLGVRLDEVLAEAGISPEATQLVPRSVDGYTGGFPVAAAMDGRNALIAVGMNGEPLPTIHGYPVRLVVPGLYGYVSAVKWLTELELTTFEAFDHYWERRNWATEAPIKVQSRIDNLRGLQQVAAGELTIAGVAWAQTRGVAMVEVQVGDSDWQEADLAAVPNDDTWRQWRLVTRVEPGTPRIRVRATAGDGVTQSEERIAPIPDGAEGWHTVPIRVV